MKMSPSTLLLFILSTFTHLLDLSFAQKGCSSQGEFCWNCSNKGNYANSSKYKENLNSLLSSISSPNNRTNFGFYNTSLGENLNRVNVIALCRGDHAQDKCQSCLQNSSGLLRERCPSKMEAILWHEHCMIRYSNESIFFIKKDEPYEVLPSPNKAADAEQFKLVLKPLLDDLKGKAASGDSLRKYAFGNATVPNAEAIFALVQCTPDLTEQDCNDCLGNATLRIPDCCEGKQGGRVLTPSCNLRYESGPFYDTEAAASSVICTQDAKYCWGCSDIGNETSTGAYSENLKNILSYISSNNIYGFQNSSLGESPNKVNVIALCRGDIAEEKCRSCLNLSSQRLLDNCPNKKEAIIWDELCMVRFSNNSIFSVKMDEPSKYFASPNKAWDPTLFKVKLKPLLDTLSSKAASGDSLKKFASGNDQVPGYEKIYATAQCTPDLDLQQCDDCLEEASLLIPQCCDGMQGARLLKPRIFIKLRNTREFHQATEEIGGLESLQYDFSTIRNATDNFSEENKLGQGGFGAVYKGRLSNGEDIAVKRLSKGSGQGDIEFKNEVLIVAKLQHRNLVRLLGFCLEGDERLLVYEFVQNASLDHFIFDPIKRTNLDWDMRYKIIGGIGRGLLYLHEDSRLRIIHRDLKASNILLDENMTAKIADFGMAKLFVIDQTQSNTSRIVGTYGYMAPEYVMHGQFSVKSDVYSFGVLLLEIVSGQKTNSFRHDEHLDYLSYAWKNWRAGTASNLVDPLMRIGSMSEVLRSLHIGLLCVQENVAHRPTMNTIALMLNSHSVSLPVPSQPAYFMRSDAVSDRTLLVSDSNSASVDEASITSLYPR
ncbi:hypothetical protein UlMin_011545 [Ulmus minor]